MKTAFYASNTMHWLGATAFLFLSIYCLRYRKEALGRALVLFFTLCGLWSLMAALIFVVPTLPEKIALNRIKMISPTLLPLSILWFALCFVHRPRISKAVWLILAVIPSVGMGLLLSSQHELFIGNYSLIKLGRPSILAFQNGPWFFYHNIFARAVTVFAIGTLLARRPEYEEFHRTHIWLIGISIIIPFVLDSVAIYFLPELRFAQVVPTAFLITAMILIYSIQHSRWLDFIPVARDFILDSLPDAYLVTDPSGRVVNANASARNLFPDSLRGFGKRNPLLSQVLPVLPVPGAPAREWKWRDRFYSLHALHLPRTGSVPATLICVKDVTDYLETQQKLKELGEMKTKLLAIVTHDLVSNLRGIAMVSDKLSSEASFSDGERKNAASVLNQSVKEMSRFVERLLSWSKLRLGLSKPHLANVDLVQLAKEVADFISPVAQTRDISIRVDASAVSCVKADENMIHTVIRNLVDNAVKFAPAGSQVSLHVASEESFLTFRVGPPKQDEPERFRSLTEKEGEILDWASGDRAASGFGLVVCCEFLRLHQGELQVANSEKEQPTFLFKLPR